MPRTTRPSYHSSFRQIAIRNVYRIQVLGLGSMLVFALVDRRTTDATTDISAAIRLADEHLYEAKHQGRDRVVGYTGQKGCDERLTKPA